MGGTLISRFVGVVLRTHLQPDASSETPRLSLSLLASDRLTAVFYAMCHLSSTRCSVSASAQAVATNVRFDVSSDAVRCYRWNYIKVDFIRASCPVIGDSATGKVGRRVCPD